MSKTAEYISFYGSLQIDNGSNYFTSYMTALHSRVLSKRDAVAYALYCRGVNSEDLALYVSWHTAELMVDKVLMSESFPDIWEDIREIDLELSVHNYLTIRQKLKSLEEGREWDVFA